MNLFELLRAWQMDPKNQEAKIKFLLAFRRSGGLIPQSSQKKVVTEILVPCALEVIDSSIADVHISFNFSHDIESNIIDIGELDDFDPETGWTLNLTIKIPNDISIEEPYGSLRSKTFGRIDQIGSIFGKRYQKCLAKVVHKRHSKIISDLRIEAIALEDAALNLLQAGDAYEGAILYDEAQDIYAIINQQFSSAPYGFVTDIVLARDVQDPPYTRFSDLQIDLVFRDDPQLWKELIGK